MRRAFTLLGLVAVLLAASGPPARAQLLIGGSGGGELVGVTIIPTTVEGRLAVEFSANPGTGCTAPCDLQGRVVWTPARTSDLTIIDTRVGGRIESSVSLDSEDDVGDRPATAAEVTRAGSSGAPGHCQDARADQYAALDFSNETPGTAVARLAAPKGTVSYGADLLSTRCAGPLEADVASAVPTRVLALDALRKGSMTVDLTGTRQFASNGMAGTVRSSVVLRLGRPEAFGAGPPDGFERALRELTRERLRTVSAIYDVERLSGDIVTTFEGGTQPELCRPLDACGVRGTVKVSHAVAEGEAVLTAVGPARLSRRELGAALGLYPGRRRSAVLTVGSVIWDADPGRTLSTVVDAGGRSCSDSAGLASGILDLTFSRRSVRAVYGVAGLFDGDFLRSRCPGPGLVDISDGSEPVAQGAIPRRSFRKRRVSITLREGSAFATGAYTGRVQTGLTLTLRRVRVENSAFSIPSLPGLSIR